MEHGDSYLSLQNLVQHMQARLEVENDHTYHKILRDESDYEYPSSDSEEIDVVTVPSPTTDLESKDITVKQEASLPEDCQVYRGQRNAATVAKHNILQICRSYEREKVPRRRNKHHKRKSDKPNISLEVQKTGSSDDIGLDVKVGRNPERSSQLHNQSERRRRTQLRALFDSVERLLPAESSKRLRLSESRILSSAARYCRELTQEHAELQMVAGELDRNQKHLTKHLFYLERKLAVASQFVGL